MKRINGLLKKIVGTFTLASLFTLSSFSQILEPVTWDFTTIDLGNNEYELVFTAKIDEPWHLYSQKIDMQPPATLFVFEENTNIELIGEVSETESVEVFDPNFDMMIRYFSHEAVFKQKIRVLNGISTTVKGFVEFMSCDDTRCLPPAEVDFEFKNIGIGEAVSEIRTTSDIETEPASNTEDKSLWVFFIIALGAGFIGVLTPCVYPMIPMTVTFFINSSRNKSQVKTNALVYGLSIILIYTFIGVLVSVIFGSNSIKEVSSHWVTNTIFFLIFTIFSASFFGLFEFVLPSSITNKSDRQADKGGIVGSFFMALTLVLVSFSCTAPFVGGILVEASTGSLIKPIIGMFGFSLAFALPFTLLAFFPSLMEKLPKSGGWLNSVKVVLGFIILALGMKFLLVPNQALGWGLTRELFIAIWIVLFTLMGFYLLGKIKFSHDSDISHISVPRLLLVVITFTFVVYLIPGMIGAPLKSLSGFLPSESSFNLVEIIKKNRGTSVVANPKSEICEEPKYSDIFKLPHGLQGYFDYEQGMACAKKLNKPVMIDFKGHACTNCKVMEKNVWSDPEVLRRLSEDYVIIALYVDDRTVLAEADWVTSSVDGKVKKTIGKKNADFQVANYRVNAQPYYILIDHEGNSLTGARAFDLSIEGFVEFLDEGIKGFKKPKINL
ncbi:MAG: thioredoxin fold domain-containing protein [Bacteroidetes bacterium]|nr:thioredoxin fold domain-containing protein [Bacteroidota bacterium]